MCGIFGVINKKIDYDLAKKCLDTIAHRGPDSDGIWQENGVTLGHRRLAILDLSEKGRQPMSYAEGRYMLVFNGEIFNFIEVRDELEKLGYRFASDADSEVILAAYDKWGSECVSRFNGMWSFLIYDREKKLTFMSRDRYGVKPLYYSVLDENDNGYAFASEMKAIMPLISNPHANEEIVTDAKRIVYYESTEECVIKEIKRFPAGCNGILDENGLKITRYYNTLDHIVDVPESYEEQVEMMRELFLDACRIRMRSDVTIGTALSGGLDSSATICAMSHLSKTSSDRMNNDWQHAYVATFPGTTMDESMYARQVTDYLGIGSTFVEINPLKAIDRLDDFVYKFEDVYLTSPIPMMLLYGALRENGTIVTIDGHGADELFGGYTFDFIHALDDAKTKEEKDMILSAYIDSFPHDDSNISMNASKKKVYFNYLKRCLKDKIRKSSGASYMNVRAAGDSRYKELDSLNRILYASSHETILPTLLRNYDRYSMANSVEIRMPFMDYRIVEFAMSIGFRSKLHGGYSKSIVRDAMAPYMPESIAYRKTKIGFNTPIVEWMQGPLKEYFTDKISSADFANSTYIDKEKVKSEILSVINNEKATFADGEKAWSDFYPYLWEQDFLKNEKHIK